MPSPSKILGVAAAATGASAAFQGFNYGATFADGRLRVQSDFESMFEAAQGLAGTDGAFTSARLYTMIVSLFCTLCPLQPCRNSR